MPPKRKAESQENGEIHRTKLSSASNGLEMLMHAALGVAPTIKENNISDEESSASSMLKTAVQQANPIISAYSELMKLGFNDEYIKEILYGKNLDRNAPKLLDILNKNIDGIIDFQKSFGKLEPLITMLSRISVKKMQDIIEEFFAANIIDLLCHMHESGFAIEKIATMAYRTSTELVLTIYALAENLEKIKELADNGKITIQHFISIVSDSGTNTPHAIKAFMDNVDELLQFVDKTKGFKFSNVSSILHGAKSYTLEAIKGFLSIKNEISYLVNKGFISASEVSEYLKNTYINIEAKFEAFKATKSLVDTYAIYLKENNISDEEFSPSPTYAIITDEATNDRIKVSSKPTASTQSAHPALTKLGFNDDFIKKICTPDEKLEIYIPLLLGTLNMYIKGIKSFMTLNGTVENLEQMLSNISYQNFHTIIQGFFSHNTIGLLGNMIKSGFTMSEIATIAHDSSTNLLPTLKVLSEALPTLKQLVTEKKITITNFTSIIGGVGIDAPKAIQAFMDNVDKLLEFVDENKGSFTFEDISNILHGAKGNTPQVIEAFLRIKDEISYLVNNNFIVASQVSIALNNAHTDIETRFIKFKKFKGVMDVYQPFDKQESLAPEEVNHVFQSEDEVDIVGDSD